jgi:polyisoprenoid-binding protein YceI
MRHWLAATLLAMLLTACSHKAPETLQKTTSLPDFPDKVYLQAPPDDVYAIDVKNSKADILVRRGGSLSRLGHDHVVTANDIQGLILYSDDALNRSRADLRVNLNSLVVDDQASRQQYNLDTSPSEDDIRKTAENMRRKVLHSDQWPEVHLFIAVTGGAPQAVQANLTVYLHGKSKQFPLTFKLQNTTDARLTASGTVTLLQSDFGIEPFSVLGGALKVMDELTIHFHIEALPRG